MKRTTPALIALSLLGSIASVSTVFAQQAPHPVNDYGVLSEEVVTQRLKLLGHSVTQIVKTPTGYRITTTQNGTAHTLDVNATSGHVLENGTRIHLPPMVGPVKIYHPEMEMPK
ncbi:MAG TPA: hypothetical protein VKG05_06665 [Steroidobacteraceae bacterium]|nr:hypothetical protein [Steroidobacteraceae bacterium]